MSDLIAELHDSDMKGFQRHPAPSVFAEYQVFMATGRYPYIADVVADIIAKYDVPPDLWEQLSREVYLSSGSFQVIQMEEKEAALREQGYLPITELVPVNGMKIELSNGTVYRIVQTNNARGDWALLPPKKRTHGVSLHGLIAQHQAFELAKLEGQTRMNGPHVRMFKPVAS